MISNSGRVIQVEIPHDYTITVQGVRIRVFTTLSHCKFIDKTVIKSSGGRIMLISQEVYSAIKMFEQSDGYAGMKLATYLEKMFSKDST